jgi:hypothetical protein
VRNLVRSLAWRTDWEIIEDHHNDYCPPEKIVWQRPIPSRISGPPWSWSSTNGPVAFPKEGRDGEKTGVALVFKHVTWSHDYSESHFPITVIAGRLVLKYCPESPGTEKAKCRPMGG